MVALADKMDTLRECFRVGMMPTGRKDPFALRRAAQGVVKILVEGRSSSRCCDSGGDAAADRVLRRSRPLLLPRCPRLQVRRSERRAWRPAGTICRIWKRGCRGCSSLRPTPDFEPLAASFKRISNILGRPKFTGGGAVGGRTAGSRSRSRSLRRRFARIAGQPIESGHRRALRPKVDLFFDKVLVNAPEPQVRQNRLALLHNLLAEFSNFCRFF